MSMNHWAPLERKSPFKHFSKDFQHPIELDHRYCVCTEMWQLTIWGKISIRLCRNCYTAWYKQSGPFVLPIAFRTHQTTTTSAQHTTPEELWNPNNPHLAADHFCPAGITSIISCLGPTWAVHVLWPLQNSWGKPLALGRPRGQRLPWGDAPEVRPLEAASGKELSWAFWAVVFWWPNCRADKPLTHLTTQAQ